MGAGEYRSRPCWCDSGKKYKNCHIDREQEEAIPLSTHYAQMRKHPRMCLAPGAPDGCSAKIIAAHTVQRRGSLTKIAENGKVVYFQHGPGMLPVRARSPLPRGLRQASTFFGFCESHDNMLFRLLEGFPFAGTAEQVTLLTYRAVCWELYANLNVRDFYEWESRGDTGRSPAEQMHHQQVIQGVLAGTRFAIDDMTSIKNRLEREIQRRDYADVRALIVAFDAPPPVMVSCGFAPKYDFEGNQIQKLADPAFWKLGARLDGAWLSLFASGDKGVLVLSWLEGSTAAEQLVASLRAVGGDDESSAAIRLAFEVSENLCISPHWWESLGEPQRQSLRDQLASGIENFGAHVPDSLVDKGIRYPWPTIQSRTMLTA